MSLLRFSLDDPSSITSLGITLMLMLMGFIYYYFYSNSSSSATKKKRFKYDVFSSFRDEDTRKNFFDHLYQALKDKCIYTYKDAEKIQGKGKKVSDELIIAYEEVYKVFIKLIEVYVEEDDDDGYEMMIGGGNDGEGSYDLFESIEDSKFYIIVFSKKYASSSWCLEELYDVEPTEVRNQSGSVKKAFSKNKNKEAAEKWREALKEAADLAGWELKNTLDGHEAKFIQKIVQEISLELRSINFGFDEKLVGMETRVKAVVSSLEPGTDEVRMIGIKGMGGAGKTTLARGVFDHLSNDFEVKIFVENVREVTNASMFGLKKLQEQVLSKVLNEHISDVTLYSVDDGKNMMKKRMCGKKVLLVLDDVNHIDQLKALAGEPKWFKSGSRILITTRDEQVLVAHGVKFIRNIVLLSEQEAISLFSKYAFGRENPLQGYEELSEKVLRYAAGLPLTIKILGSFLCGKDKNEWLDAIDRLENIPLKDTLEKLELSYTSLEDEYKEIFLDIACILKGQTKEDAIRVLECCGFHATNGLKVLEQRSLITVDEDGELGMHDHIEEMGQNIVRRSHPDEPNKHSRLWIDEEIEDMLANDMGTEATRCLKLTESNRNAKIVMKGLGKMKKLRYLEVTFVYYNAECLDDTSQYFSNSLRYLKCTNYPFLYLPKTFQANKLVGLEMECSRRMVQLWEEGEKKVLNKLKFLSLSGSNLMIFDFRITPNLETLSLNYSLNLKELRMLASCQKLKYLQISRSKLRTFDLGLTPNLETLSLLCCADFVELYLSVACPNLKFLSLSSSRLRSLDLELIPNLESLDLRRCHELVEINAPVGCLKKVVHLDLSGCELLEKLPEDIGRSECLKELDITDMECSRRMVQLWEEGEKKVLNKLKFLQISRSKLRTFDLGLTPNLVTLSLFCCADFVELHVSGACPNLKFLDLSLSGLRSLDLELIPNLERLDLERCDELVEINAPVGCLKKVVRLNLSGCELLEKLPEDIGRSKCLKELDITDTGISHLPQSIFELKGLIIAARQELLELYDFPSEIETTTSTLDWTKT